MLKNCLPVIATVAVVGTVSSAYAAYINAIDAANPVAHYRFSETSGTTVADANLDSDIATVYNGAASAGVNLNVSGPGAASGLNGFEVGNSAASFNNSNTGNVLLPNSGTNNIGAVIDNGVKSGGTGLSAIFWVKPSTTNSQQALFGDRAGNPLIQLLLNDNTAGDGVSAGTIRFLLRGDTTAPAATRTGITAAGVVGTADWSMIALTYQPSDQAIHIYVNGEDKAITVAGTANPIATAFAGSSPQTALGQTYSASTGQRFFNGLMDEVSFFNRVLTGTEVQSLYNAAVPEPTSLSAIAMGVALLGRRRSRR
jgi:hypothetical protein